MDKFTKCSTKSSSLVFIPLIPTGIIREELLEIKNKYADERRTNIDMSAIEFIEDESLIPEEDIMIALTHNGYIKRTLIQILPLLRILSNSVILVLLTIPVFSLQDSGSIYAN